MKILVVEDMPTRKAWFEVVMEGHDLLITEHADVACSNIFDTEYDEIWLDHDLGIHCEDGMTVVEYLVSSGRQKEANIKIHSCNTPAAIAMKKKLYHAGYKVELASFILLCGHTRDLKVDYQERL